MSKQLIQAATEVASGNGTTSQMLLEELKDFQARDIFNMQVIQKLPFVDSGDGTGEEEDSDRPEIAPDSKIHNLEMTVGGHVLDKQAKKANNKYRGDIYPQSGTYHAKMERKDGALLKEYVRVNNKSTVKLNDNLEGKYKDNKAAFATLVKNEDIDEPQLWSDLKNLRDTDNDLVVKNDTIMQKVITKDTAMAFVKESYDTVGGCVSKACDAAPFVYNVESAYDNLRLDYFQENEKTGKNDNPYPKLKDEKKDIYVLRYLGDSTNLSRSYPDLAKKFIPPCTETGFLGGDQYLIPEYFVPNRVQIYDGAIFCIDKDGNEMLFAYMVDEIAEDGSVKKVFKSADK
ncbi:MAG: hypothetical protein K6F51_09490 [Acetatifactor sp.]|nr:hypothetical protein [Acetatifactor sp.]